MILYDNYAGLSVSSEIDNKILIFSGNYEHELFKIGPSLIGVGASIKYSNWTSGVVRNSFIAGQINCNFITIGDGKFVPFIGVMTGTNLEFKRTFYHGQIGLRYFIERDVSIVLKYGFGKWSYIIPEVGVEYRF
jgi:hypothetical protein